MVPGDIKLNLGCELHTPTGWVNIDGSWGAWLAKYQKLHQILKLWKILPAEQLEKPWPPDILVRDVRKPLPFEDNTVSVIYASHLLEHIFLTEAQALLNECFRVLKRHGIIRIVVPDLKAFIDEYLKAKNVAAPEVELGEICRADLFNKRLLLRGESPPSGNIFYKIYTLVKDYHKHKWMYDVESLVCHIKAAGFVEVSEKQVYESRIEDIDQVEMAEKVVGGAGICVEGIKP